MAVTAPTCPSNFATFDCKYKFSTMRWEALQEHGMDANLINMFALSYLTFHIPNFDNSFRRACSKDKTIWVESCCCVSILPRSLANLKNSNCQNGESLDVDVCRNLCKVPHLCEARPCWNIIKAPCVISWSSYEVLLSSMDSDSFDLVYFQKKNQNLRSQNYQNQQRDLL